MNAAAPEETELSELPVIECDEEEFKTSGPDSESFLQCLSNRN